MHAGMLYSVVPADVAAGELRSISIGGGDVLITAHTLPKGGRVCELVAAPEIADELLVKLAKAAQPAAERVYLDWRLQQGADRVGVVPSASPHDSAKPYFIGQKALVGVGFANAAKSEFVAHGLPPGRG